MALRTASEIVRAIKERKSEVDDLRQRFEGDYGLWRLKAFRIGTTYKDASKDEYDNYTSNEPRTLADKVVGDLAHAQLKIEIPIGDDDEKTRKTKANAERYLYGALNLIDSRATARVESRTQTALSWYAVVRGQYALRFYMRKNDKRETIPDLAVWDMLNTYWERGPEGLLWGGHIRTPKASQIKAEYGLDIKEKKATIYDFWDDTKEIVVLKDTIIHEIDHSLGYPPIFVAMVGATPAIESEEYTDTIKDVGESIYAGNRSIYPSKNKWVTYLATIVGQGVHNPLALYSSGGTKMLEGSPYHKGAVVPLDIDKQEKIEPIWQPAMPRDAGALLALVNRELSMGGLPPITFGELNFQMPGYGIGLLHHAAESKMFAPQEAVELGIEWLSRELLHQFKGFKPLKLHGRDSSGEYFEGKFSPSDVKGDWFPKAKLLVRLPEDEPGKYNMAQIAVQNELLSAETARSKLLGVEDPDLEGEKILREKALGLPSITLRRMAAALKREGRLDLAAILMEEITGRESARQAKTERPYETGIPPTAMPPEVIGRRIPSPQERLIEGIE